MSLAITDNMLRISSHPNNIRYVESFVHRLAEEHQLTEEKFGDILVCVTEAVNNAILHGNHGDERKKVLVRAEHAGRTLAIVVEDEGCGFDYRAIPNPTEGDNLTRIGGRGVFVMFKLCDTVRYLKNGRQVEMAFRL